MDWNDSLLWLIGLSVAIFAARVVMQRPIPRGWGIVVILVGATTGAGWFLFRDLVGYAILAEWLLLVLFPSLAQRTSLRLVNTRHPAAARWIARLAAWMHPADGWFATTAFVDALAALQEGRTAEGRQLLAALQDRDSSLGRTAIAMLVRHTADWQGYLDWIDVQFDRDRLLKDSALLDVYLQALGETGRRCEMLTEFSRLLAGESHSPARVRVAAFCGDDATVQAILDGPLQNWPREIAEFWMATARQVRGDPAADAVFDRLQRSPSGIVSGAAQRRLDSPLRPIAVNEFDDVARHVIDKLHHDAVHEAEFAVLSSTPYRRPVVTWMIGLLLTANFIREIPGGAEDEQNLIVLGAVIIPRYPDFAEWWRPFTAAFLHFGWAHFLMNLFGLLFLGVRLERAWGWWKTLVCYLAAIVVSMTATPLLIAETSDKQILAGASGGIMGLLGGLLGHLLVGRWRRRTPQVAQELSLLVAFVLLQTVFDLSHAQVSQEAHLLGLGTGCVCGLVFGLTLRTKKPLRSEPVDVLDQAVHASAP